MLPFLAMAVMAAASPQAEPAPQPPTQEEPARRAASETRYSVETTPIQVLEADPEARTVVVKHLPSLFGHPAYSMIKTMSLRAIAPYSQGAINDQALAALQADLDALNP